MDTRRLSLSLSYLLTLIGLCAVVAAPVAFAQSGSPARRVISGGVLPTTCLSSVLIKDVWYKTGSGAGLYICTSANTWTQQSASGSAMSVPMGGTGQSSLTLNNVLLGNGASAVQFVAPGTSGNVLTSNGTTWTSAAAAGGSISGSTGSTDNAMLAADGTGGATLQARDITVSDPSSSIVTVATTAGNALTVSATAPAQASGSQAGKSIVLTPSNAVDGSSTHAAALGGFISLNTGATVNGGTDGQVQVIRSGTAAAPALCVGATAGALCQAGFMNTGFGLALTNGGAKTVDFILGRVAMQSNGQVSISSDTNTDNADTRLTRCGVACWQMGDAASATPVNQQLSAQWGSGTDISGAKLTLTPGKGTGSGAPGDLNIQTSFPLASGTTAQSFGGRLYIRGAPKDLTESSATPLVTSVGVASGTVTGGVLEYTVEANDATDFQSHSGVVQFAAVNKGGTLTVTDNTTAGVPASQPACACSTGTLTETVTFTTGTNTIIPNVTAVSSLTQTTLRATFQIRLNGGTGTVNP